MYYHLSLDLPAEARGVDLTAEDMRKYNASVEKFSAFSGDEVRGRLTVGSWNPDVGEYVLSDYPDENCSMQIEATFQGCVLKLSSPTARAVQEIYVEHMQDTNEWRVNFAHGHDCVGSTCIDKDGELQFD